MKISFTPAIYEHAARFVGRTPWDVSRDAELLFAAHRATYREYHHQVIVVGIDIYNLEAEAYGARIVPAGGDGIPAVEEPLLESLEQGIQLRPFNPQRDGRIAMSIAVGQRLKREFPDADVRLPVAGPFSIAFNLRGITQLCEDAALEPELTAKLLWRLAENQAVLCQAVADAGLDVAFFESAASPPMLSPAQFRQLELPALRRVMALAADCAGHPVPCILGGNTYPIVDDILSTGTAFVVCNIETDQATFMARVAQTHPHVKVRVNMDPAVVVCSDRQRIYREVERVVNVIAGHGNGLIGTGALALETPPENIHLIERYLAARDA